MDTYTFYHRTVEGWADRVNEVYPEQWDEPTPCREWTVRDLVNHVVGEDRWTVQLVNGSTIHSPTPVGVCHENASLGSNGLEAARSSCSIATSAAAAKKTAVKTTKRAFINITSLLGLHSVVPASFNTRPKLQSCAQNLPLTPKLQMRSFATP